MERRNEAEPSISCMLVCYRQKCRDRKILEKRGRRRKSEGAEMPALKKSPKMRNPDLHLAPRSGLGSAIHLGQSRHPPIIMYSFSTEPR